MGTIKMAGNRKVEIASTFDTSGVTAGAEKAADALKNIDKSVKSTRFDTAHIDTYNKALDKLANKRVKISVDEKGLTRAGAQVKRMLADLKLAKAMEGKGSHWRDYEKAKIDYQSKGKGADFDKQFASVRRGNESRDQDLVVKADQERAQKRAQAEAKANAQSAKAKARMDKDAAQKAFVDQMSMEVEEREKWAKKGKGAGGDTGGDGGTGGGGGRGGPGLLGGIGRGIRLAGRAGGSMTKGAGAAADSASFGIAGMAARNPIGAVVAATVAYVPKILDGVTDKITDLSEKWVPGLRKALNDMVDPRALGSLSHLKDDLAEAGKEADRLANKFDTNAASYEQWRAKELRLARSTGRTERERGAYQEAATDPSTLSERWNEKFSGDRAQYLHRRFSGEDYEKMQMQIASRMHKKGESEQEKIAVDKRAEEILGGVKQGHEKEIQEAMRYLGARNKYTTDLQKSMNLEEVAKEDLWKGRAEGQPTAAVQSDERVADIAKIAKFQREIGADGSKTVEQKEREIALYKQQLPLERTLGADAAKKAIDAESDALKEDRATAMRDQTQELREQNDQQAKLLQKYDGSTKYAQQIAEIERQHLIDVKNVGQATADNLETERKRAVEREKTEKFTRETQQFNRGMAFNKMPGMSLEQQARFPQLFNRLKQLDERAHQENWTGAQLRQRQREAGQEVQFEHRQGVARSTFLETRNPQEKMKAELQELMGAAGLLGGKATMDMDTYQRKRFNMALENKDVGTTGWGAVEANSMEAYTLFAKNQNETQNIQSEMLREQQLTNQILREQSMKMSSRGGQQQLLDPNIPFGQNNPAIPPNGLF